MDANTPTPQYYPPPTAPQSNRTVLYIVVGVLVACLCCGLIAGAAALVGGAGVFRVVTGLASEAEGVTSTIDGYLRAMAQQDAETAQTYFAPDSGVRASRLRQEFSGSAFDAYADYESSSVNSFHVDSTNGDTTTQISGTIRYSNGSTGSFDASLTKIGDEWKLAAIPEITVGR